MDKQRQDRGRRRWLALSLAACLAATGSALAQGVEVATATFTPAQVFWQPQVSYGTLILTVSEPGGEVLRHEFTPGEAVVYPFDAQSAALPNGPYIYELRVIPAFDQGIRAALVNARKQGNDDAMVRTYQQQGVLPTEPLTQTGAFTVEGGTIIVPGATTEAE